MSDGRNAPQLQDAELNLHVTKAPSHILEHASLDVARWYNILAHPTVLAQGTIEKNADRNDTLIVQSTAPSQLASQTHKSLIKHLSECFYQWNGTLEFEFIATIPMFVAIKLVMAFVPTISNAASLDASTLAGMQNAVVCSAQNSYKVTLRVPFISGSNWIPCTLATGSLIIKLMERPVFSQELSGPLPWTLFVRADPTDFNFRYITPPPQPTKVTSVTDNSGITQADHAYATNTSTRKSGQRTLRTARDLALVRQPSAWTSNYYQSMMLVPRSRIEFVMQKVRGQYPALASQPNSVYAVRNMFDVPSFSLSTYSLDDLPPIHCIFPFLFNSFAYYVGYVGNDLMNTQGCPLYIYVYERMPHSLFLQLPVNHSVDIELLKDKRVYFEVAKPNVRQLALWKFTNITRPQRLNGTSVTLEYIQLYYVSGAQENSYTSGLYWTESAVIQWSPIDAQPDANKILASLREVDQAPPEVTHLALYTTMPPELATTFCNWLTTSDNTSPPLACLSYSISFSPAQNALSWNDGRLLDSSEQATRGIVWKLFKLFKGNENAWWAWLVRALDLVVDCLIGAFVGRADQSAVVDIAPGSGYYVEPMGTYDSSKLETPTSTSSLTSYPNPALPSLTSTFAAAEMPEKHSLFRRRSRANSISEISLETITPPKDAEPPAPSRRRSPRWQARHPAHRSFVGLLRR